MNNPREIRDREIERLQERHLELNGIIGFYLNHKITTEMLDKYVTKRKEKLNKGIQQAKDTYKATQAKGTSSRFSDLPNDLVSGEVW